jgi:hypothetical protein
MSSEKSGRNHGEGRCDLCRTKDVFQTREFDSRESPTEDFSPLRSRRLRRQTPRSLLSDAVPARMTKYHSGIRLMPHGDGNSTGLQCRLEEQGEQPAAEFSKL